MESRTNKQVQAFLNRAGQPPGVEHIVRRIGTDDDMVRAIIERIASGEKTMTYSLPWLAESSQDAEPVAGRLVVALDSSGRPALLLRITGVRRLRFGDVGPDDVAREGIPMRDVRAWRPLHVAVWNEKLKPIGRRVSDDMPVWAEFFDLLYTEIP